ncbi:MAG: hypothetical protein QM691_01395 [Opitutaceae bacterium]
MNRIAPLLLAAFLGAVTAIAQTSMPGAAADAAPKRGPFATMFWTWQDREIENPEVLLAELRDLKAAGFDGLFTMPRATRYHLFDDEMTAAVQLASEACRREGIKFIWGPDPRFAAHPIVAETGYGAEVLLTGLDFMAKRPAADSPETDPERQLLNECRVEGGRYSLRFNYPVRRDIHMLTEVSMWFNPVGVDRVIAYRRSGDGKVLADSVRDITAGHHFFVNRALSYVEVFGRVQLPAGEWWVVAFPRFRTNLYAFDAPEHEKRMIALLDRYKARGIAFDGFWWDEPGYTLQFGQYAISDRIYADFRAKYGYDLRENLHALLLPLDDGRHLRVRHDYFQLLMDYVFGAEHRFWQAGEKRFGPLRMGIHHNWHSMPDNIYHGSADPWRGLEAVDAGYTDDSGFEGYFSGSLARRFEQVSYMIQAASLGRFSRSGKAFYNRWGVKYGPEVAAYWNDLMPLFSNQWLQHSYGSTGAIGGGRDFGPGFPNHPTWPLLPGWIEKTRRVHAITGYRLPLAEVAVVYPVPTVLVGREPENDALINRVNRLVGAMPAAGVGVDAISESFFAEGKLEAGAFVVRGQRYRAVVLPHARVLSAAGLVQVRTLLAAKFPIHFTEELPAVTIDGAPIALTGAAVAFKTPDDATTLPELIESLHLPSMLTRLPGAYVSALPGEGDTTLVLVMPIEPGATVAGEMACRGVRFTVAPTSTLAIYEVGAAGARPVALE